MTTIAKEREQKYEAAPGTASTAGGVVLAYLDAHAARLKALAPAVRRDEPDAVHQMRVTTRRLRSALQSFPKVLHEPRSPGRSTRIAISRCSPNSTGCLTTPRSPQTRPSPPAPCWPRRSSTPVSRPGAGSA